MENEKEGVRS